MRTTITGARQIDVTTVTSSRSSRVLRGALVAIALAIAAPVAAQDDERSPDAPDLPQEAETPAWVREGNALLEEGKAAEAAQMFEANPGLTPRQAKLILIKTATRLRHISPDRQGWGVVNPKTAVLRALRAEKGEALGTRR